MVDVADTVPPAMDIDGNLVIWWVPTIADLAAVKAATEIGGAGSFRLTHSFTPGGFNFGGSQQVPGANGWGQALGTGLAAYGAFK